MLMDEYDDNGEHDDDRHDKDKHDNKSTLWVFSTLNL